MLTLEEDIEQTIGTTVQVEDLNESVPIYFCWLAREPEKFPNQHPIPEKMHAQNTLKKWSETEPKRKVVMFYCSHNLNDKQKKMMDELNKIAQNIEVIDYNERFREYNLDFLTNELIPFAWKIDLMRLIPLLEKGPAKYFDLDIFPKKETRKSKITKQIGSLKINNKEGILMANEERTGVQNSIIAVNSSNNELLRLVFDTVTDVINDPDHLKLEKLSKMRGSLVYRLQVFCIQYAYEFGKLPDRKTLKAKVQECVSLNVWGKRLENGFSQVFGSGKEKKTIELLERYCFPQIVTIGHFRSWIDSEKAKIKFRKTESRVNNKKGVLNERDILINNIIKCIDFCTEKIELVKHIDNLKRFMVDKSIIINLLEHEEVMKAIKNAIEKERKEGKSFKQKNNKGKYVELIKIIIKEQRELIPNMRKPDDIHSHVELSECWDKEVEKAETTLSDQRKLDIKNNIIVSPRKSSDNTSISSMLNDILVALTEVPIYGINL